MIPSDRVEGRSRACDGSKRDAHPSMAAPGQWECARADIKLAATLGINALAIGVSWCRVEPEPGQIDEEALRHYVSVVHQCADAGIAPYLVLHHVCTPQWFQRIGYWNAREASVHFANYAKCISEACGDDVAGWIPMLEPAYWRHTVQRVRGWPRHVMGLRSAHDTREGMDRVGESAKAAIRDVHPSARIGASIGYHGVRPIDPTSVWDTRIAKRVASELNAIPHDIESSDFVWLGLGQDIVAGTHALRPGQGFVACSQQPTLTISRDALNRALERLGRVQVPIHILAPPDTADDDAGKSSQLIHLIDAIESASASDRRIEGFIWKNLLDSDEYGHGDEQRTGLIHVDRETLARTPNRSAFLLREYARTGHVSPAARQRLVEIS